MTPNSMSIANEVSPPRAPRPPRPATHAFGVVEAPPPGLRARQLRADARRAALEQLQLLEGAMTSLAELSQEVLDGGDLYAPGVRDLARRLTEDMFWRGKTLQSLYARQADADRG